MGSLWKQAFILTIIFEETCSIGHNEIKKEYTENDFKKDNIELLKGFNKIYWEK